MRTTFFLICLLAHFISVKAAGPYCVGDTLNCLALNGLKLRATPKGKEMASIKLGETVIVIAKWDSLTKSDTYEKIYGNWVRVKYNTQIGYVFDGYLSKMPAPSLQDSSLEEYLDRVSVQIGKPVTKTSFCEGEGGGEGAYSVTIRQYQQDNFTAKRIDYGGWEWGHSTIVFDFVEFEEIFLICKVVFRNSYANGVFEIPERFVENAIVVNTNDDSGYDNFTLKYFSIEGRDSEIRVIIDTGY
jgi:hypothetical protein